MKRVPVTPRYRGPITRYTEKRRIDVIIKNNMELIKGVDRASTTTVSALRTAVITAQALGNQKLVLDQITALNATTSGLIVRAVPIAARTSSRVVRPTATPRPRLARSTRPRLGFGPTTSKIRGRPPSRNWKSNSTTDRLRCSIPAAWA